MRIFGDGVGLKNPVMVKLRFDLDFSIYIIFNEICIKKCC